MRMVIGVLSLLIVVAVVGALAKSQLRTHLGKTAAPVAADGAPLPTTSQLPLARVQPMQDQIKKAIEDAMQKTRPELDDQ